MKKSFYVFIILLLITLLVGAIFLFREQQVINNEPKQEKAIIQTETFFVPVTVFKSYGQNIPSIDNIKFISLTQNLDELALLNLEPSATFDSVDLIYENLKSEEIALLPFNEVDPRFKILKLDGQLFTKLDNLEDYPLKTVVENEINAADLTSEQQESLQEGRIIISNFDKSKLTTIFAGGEVIVGRGVDIKWLQLSNNNIKFLFDRVKDDIASADLALALMEHPYLGNPTPCANCALFVGDEALIPQYKEIGLDVFSLAGNHMGDGGLVSQERTIELLDENNIKHFGAGKNLEEASKPLIVELNGLKYAFLGADNIATFFWATETSRGSNHYIDFNGNIDTEKIEKDIKNAKELADFVILFMSWGVEYTNFATVEQQEMAHLMIDSGADLIISSHPHWIQNAEFYNGKMIFYGLGNFIFDQTHTDPTRESIYTNLIIYDGKHLSTEVVPILTCGYHFGARNLANEVINGTLTYEEVDAKDERKECIWLQPKPLDESHPRYKIILNRLFEYTKI